MEVGHSAVSGASKVALRVEKNDPAMDGYGRIRTQKAPIGWAHSHTSPECARHLCHDTAWTVREREGRIARGLLRRRFLTLVSPICTNYSYN